MVETHPLTSDLASELTECLFALPRQRYRREVHPMLTELLRVHHTDLDPHVVELAGKVIAAFAPSATPQAADLTWLAGQWTQVLRGGPGHTYNARAFCHAIAGIRPDLTSNRRAVAIYLADAIVGWDLRPSSPTELDVDRHATATADPAVPEIVMLHRFIAAARQAVAATGARKRRIVCGMTARRIEIHAEESATLPAARYLKVRQIHPSPCGPVWWYSEIDAHGAEVRTVDVFADGRYQYADARSSTGDTFLATFPTPEIAEMYWQDEFDATLIDRDEFDRLWQTARQITPDGPRSVY